MQFHIENMTCGGCVRGVTKALTRLDPEATLQADTEARTITVQTSAAREAVTQALAEAGFPAVAA
jgi:copper chaperone